MTGAHNNSDWSSGYGKCRLSFGEGNVNCSCCQKLRIHTSQSFPEFNVEEAWEKGYSF